MNARMQQKKAEKSQETQEKTQKKKDWQTNSNQGKLFRRA